MIAPDRPGVGHSTRTPGYTVADYAPMVGALTDVLRLDRFAVWGYSGGGPYALACAARLASRVSKVAVAAGSGQVGEWARTSDFEKTDRQMLDLVPRHPAVARVVLGTLARVTRRAPKVAFKSFARELAPADRAVAEAIGVEAITTMLTQAVLRDAWGVVDDYAALARPWGFDVATITVPLSLWQGDADTMVPLAHSRAVAERVPSARLTVWPREGHLATITHVHDILADLVS